MQSDSGNAAQALSLIIETLNRLDDDSRERVIRSVLTFFHVGEMAVTEASSNTARPSKFDDIERPARPNFSQTQEMTPKQFMNEKQPRTDVERVACLAYYLAHFRDMPYFKTLDLAKLNTEAAQPKFSNAAFATQNAAKLGYLAPATKNERQLSAVGELFVAALPDRDAAKAAMANARRKKINRRNQ